MNKPTLTDFLLARITEDEQAARWCAAGHGARWRLREVQREMVDDETGSEVVAYGGVRDVSTAEHIARFDPARMLAECEAKRAIVEQHSEQAHLCPSGINLWTDDGDWIGCRTLAALAAVYADHAHYRDEDWGVPSRCADCGWPTPTGKCGRCINERESRDA